MIPAGLSTGPTCGDAEPERASTGRSCGGGLAEVTEK